MTVPSADQISSFVASSAVAPFTDTSDPLYLDIEEFENAHKMAPSLQTLTDAYSKTECSHHIPSPSSGWLVLAPVTSESYPRTPPSYSPREPSSPIQSNSPAAEWFIPELASPPIDPADTLVQELEYELMRAASLSRRSSADSGPPGGFGRPRFLKLLPVHFGGNPEEPDYTEIH